MSSSEDDSPAPIQLPPQERQAVVIDGCSVILACVCCRNMPASISRVFWQSQPISHTHSSHLIPMLNQACVLRCFWGDFQSGTTPLVFRRKAKQRLLSTLLPGRHSKGSCVPSYLQIEASLKGMLFIPLLTKRQIQFRATKQGMPAFSLSSTADCWHL